MDQHEILAIFVSFLLFISITQKKLSEMVDDVYAKGKPTLHLHAWLAHSII